jgi:cytochrome c-type biogenesis protein CcmE
VVGVVIAGALAYLLVQGLGNATLYFRTADEAVAQAHSLGGRRFRIEGTVLPGVHENANAVAFVIESKGVDVAVTHVGDPPELFKPGIPVVLEGHLDGETDGRYHFASDRILVKHSETYIARHPDRLTTVPTVSPAP